MTGRSRSSPHSICSVSEPQLPGAAGTLVAQAAASPAGKEMFMQAQQEGLRLDVLMQQRMQQLRCMKI